MRIFEIVIPLNWICFLSVLLFIPKIYWPIKRKITRNFHSILLAIKGELEAVFGEFISPGSLLILMCIFFSIGIFNVLGLFPYVFTPTRHASVTISIRLPIWIGYILIRCVKQAEYNLAHLVPEGTPYGLIPVIVLIETISLFIRPFTLAIRLAANMVAGHLLITLLGGYAQMRGVTSLTVIILCLCILTVLELSVRIIQAYVFIRLRSLYSAEHNRQKIIYISQPI